MLSIETSDGETRLGSELFGLRRVPIERGQIGGRNCDDAGKLELGEASDQLRLALCDLSLGSTVTSSDPEPRPIALLGVRRESRGVSIDPPLSVGRSDRLEHHRDRSDGCSAEQKGFHPVRCHVEPRPLGDGHRLVKRSIHADVVPSGVERHWPELPFGVGSSVVDELGEAPSILYWHSTSEGIEAVTSHLGEFVGTERTVDDEACRLEASDQQAHLFGKRNDRAVLSPTAQSLGESGRGPSRRSV